MADSKVYDAADLECVEAEEVKGLLTETKVKDVKKLRAEEDYRVFRTVTAPLFIGFLLAFVFISYTLSYLGMKVVDKIRDNDDDDTVSGPTMLFDLTTDQGFLEAENVYEKWGYGNTYETLKSRADYFRTQVGDMEIADLTGLKPTWEANGGVVPWLNDSFTRTIDQLYSYSKAPNIVFFLVDDWGYNDIGYQSDYLSWTTPNVDAIAKNGIKLTNYYTSELCTPTRAAFLTGRYAFRFGMQGADLDKVELPNSEALISEELKSAGYRTYIVGKWHMGWSTNAKTPNYRGFDYYYGYLGGFIDYWTKGYGDDLDLHENNNLVTNATELSTDVHSAYLYQSHAEYIIDDHVKNYPDQPMFLYYASQLIHTDWEVPDSYKDRCSVQGSDSDTLTYCGMNLMLDDMIGRLNCALDAAGLLDNTLFILASDNGGNVLMSGSNRPFRGAKGSLFRGGQSVPAFISGPESLIPSSRRGKTYDGQMHVTGKKSSKRLCFEK